MSAPNSQNNNQTNNERSSDPLKSSRTQAARDALSRSSYGVVDSMTLGVHDVMWAVRHPLKFASRSFGFFMGGLGVFTLAIGTTYLFFGDPGTAKLTWTDPTAVVKTGIDQVRPLWRGMGEGIGDVVNGAPTSDDEYKGTDYRR